jgi:hypothetical protein
MNSDVKAFQNYLEEQGIPDKDQSVQPVTSYTRHDNYGSMTGYTLNQNITIISEDLDKIGELSLNPDFFAERGMVLSNSQLEYLYTKLPELKKQLLSEATKMLWHVPPRSLALPKPNWERCRKPERRVSDHRALFH